VADGIDDGPSTTMDTIACSLVNPRDDEQEQEMSHNKFDQFNDLVTRLAATDGTIADERSQELLDTELAREELEAIVAGIWNRITINPYEPGGMYRDSMNPVLDRTMPNLWENFGDLPPEMI
jgi:hypothetical protein